ncbi:MAG: hypothetical protein JSU73_05255 [candidate division WOR-3 bacterium]|nr:MAG: hypothetical protein JSU73_05255 [candidate division WOR-3 bacterium]
MKRSDVLPRLGAAVGAAALATLVVGCATGTGAVGKSPVIRPETPVAETPEPEREFELPSPIGPLEPPGQVAEPVPGGEVDWSGRAVRARGTGVVDPSMSNEEQARLMAERAAAIVAQNNLLEIVMVLRVDSDTRVKNLMTEHDMVYTRVDGVVKGARQLGEANYDRAAGTVEVELEVDLYGSGGVTGALQPVLGDVLTTGSLTAEVKRFLQQYSSLVFDAGALGLKPALFPRIYDEDGGLLLETRRYALHTGHPSVAPVQFISDIDRLLEHPGLRGAPLVVKVREVKGQQGTDIVIGRRDAERLRWLKDGFRFLLGTGRLLFKVQV